MNNSHYTISCSCKIIGFRWVATFTHWFIFTLWWKQCISIHFKWIYKSSPRGNGEVYYPLLSTTHVNNEKDGNLIYISHCKADYSLTIHLLFLIKTLENKYLPAYESCCSFPDKRKSKHRETKGKTNIVKQMSSETQSNTVLRNTISKACYEIKKEK